MRSTTRLLAAIGALSVAIPATAQPSASTADAAPAARTQDDDASGDTIVVTGKAGAPSRSQVYQQARDISRIDPRRLYEESLARFETPLCPGVVGLTADGAAMIVDRIRANAAQLNVKVAKANCSPNLVVAFVDDGRSLLTDLQRHRPQIFKLVSADEQSELLTEQAPVHVWNNIATRWVGAGAQPRDEPRASVRGQLNRQFMPERHDIVSALVVFDREAVLGMTIDQLADYATMRGLSHTRPATGDEPMETILSLFDQAGPSPDELTSFDVGYLKSLYWWMPNVSAVDKLLGVRKRAAQAANGP